MAIVGGLVGDLIKGSQNVAQNVFGSTYSSDTPIVNFLTGTKQAYAGPAVQGAQTGGGYTPAPNYTPTPSGRFVSTNPAINPNAGNIVQGDSRVQQLQKVQQSGGLNPSQLSELNALLQQNQPEQPSIDFDTLIKPALDALESTIPTLQQNFSEYETGQGKAKQTQREQTEQQIGEQKQTLETSRQKQNQAGESAIDEARRQFNEIQQGLQARYGGTTGTGRFAAEIAGRETLRNIGNVRQGLSQAMQEIDNKLVQVQEVGRLALQDIEDKTEERVRQARENLNLQIANIRQQQGTLQAQKAQMTAEAVQNYQNSVNQFKLEQQNFLRDLYTRQIDAENTLKQAYAKARNTAQSFTVQDLSRFAEQASPIGGVTIKGGLGAGGTVTNPNFSIAPVSAGSAGFRDPNDLNGDGIPDTFPGQ